MKAAGLGLNFMFLIFLVLLVWKITRLVIRETAGGKEASPPPEARVTLISYAGARVSPGTSFPLSAKVVLGRDPQCDIALDDEFCSGEHASISWIDGRWHFADLGSTNGIFVNGSRVQHAILRPGDRITLGQTTLALEEQ